MRCTAFFMLLSLLAAPSFAADIDAAHNWDEALAGSRPETLDAAGRILWTIELPGEDKRPFRYRHETIVAREGNIYVIRNTGYFEDSQMRLSPSFALVSKRQLIRDKRFVAFFRYNEFLLAREGDTLNWSSLKDGQPYKSGSVKLPANAIDLSALAWPLQAIVRSGRRADLSIRGLVGKDFIDLNLRFIPTDDPRALSTAYAYPDFFTFEPGVPYVAVEIMLAGMARLLFPHRQFYVFRADGDCPMVGYFGGDPAGPTFQIRVRE